MKRRENSLIQRLQGFYLQEDTKAIENKGMTTAAQNSNTFNFVHQITVRPIHLQSCIGHKHTLP